MAQKKLSQAADGLGYRPRAFGKHLAKESDTFSALSDKDQSNMASILWAMFSGRMTHNSGRDDVTPIHWRPKQAMFGSAKRFDEINAALGWFTLELKPKRGKSAGGWAMTNTAKGHCNAYLDQSRQYALSGLEPDDKGLVNQDGSPYRMPADGIRSRTATGKMSRFPRKQIEAAIEIEGDNLHAFHHAAQAWLDGDPAPAGFQWAHDKWNAIRDGRGPNSGIEKAAVRARMARDQASIMLDLAKRSGAPGFVIPTTYRESPAGRLYAEGPINLQRCVGEVRRAALSGCYDVDIANCHWSLVAQMASRLRIETPHIDHYLANKRAVRAELASAAGISTDDAKFVLLAMIYGATLVRSKREQEHAIEARLGHEAAELLRQFQPVRDLHKDVKRAGKAIIEDYIARTEKRGVLVNDAGREIGTKMNAREQLAHILQGAESMALQTMLTALQGRVALMQHDGITIHGKPDIRSLEQRIRQETGYVLTLECEPL